MLRLLTVLAAAALLVPNTTIAAADEPAPVAPGLRPVWLYNPLHRPALVEVTTPRDLARLDVILLDHAGATVAGPVAVRAGRTDLAALMPEIWRLRRAAWLQLRADDQPVGPALVVQPMLSRLIPQTVEELNPNGIRYTRIVGWADERAAEGVEIEPTEVDAATTPDDPTPGDVGDGTPAGTPETADGAPGPHPDLALRGATDRLHSGVRLWIDHDVLIRTSRGDIRISLRPDEAPNTAWNFLHLSRGGFYRDIPFHRIVPYTRHGDGFVIQAGDPTPTGSGGPGYWLPLEPSELDHDFGVISMARDVDPDSAGSQIFICLSRPGTARLDGNYCAFGEAVSGREVISDIASVELADVARGEPRDAPMIITAEPLLAPSRTPGVGRPDTPLAAVPDAAPDPEPERRAALTHAAENWIYLSS